jgi:hypothetical protein
MSSVPRCTYLTVATWTKITQNISRPTIWPDLGLAPAPATVLIYPEPLVNTALVVVKGLKMVAGGAPGPSPWLPVWRAKGTAG